MWKNCLSGSELTLSQVSSVIASVCAELKCKGWTSSQQVNSSRLGRSKANPAAMLGAVGAATVLVFFCLGETC